MTTRLTMAAAVMLANCLPVLAETTATAPLAPVAPVAGEAAAQAKPSAKQIAPSTVTAEQRSAAALGLSHEPTFDPGTAERLKQVAKTYNEIAAHGGWPMIPAGAKFTLGTPGANDDLLRKRLIASGDLAADKASGPFDDTVIEAIKHFQARHGLVMTGTIGPRTTTALNVPVEKRIKQLEASIERVANIGFNFGPRYVLVNIPAAYAEVVENDQAIRRYRVVVGKTDKPSPTVTSEINSVVLNPTWTVPTSVTSTEISAHMRKDPTYLARMHMDVLDSHNNPVDPRTVDWSADHVPNVTVRQQSGEWNALGSVKINMPNSYAVYMHDTNQRNLFADDYRFDSHGCARVDNVRDLATWLLQAQLPQWDRTAIDAAIATGQRQEVMLPKKVPVAWVYLTAWVTKDQTVQFRNDIYNQDDQLLAASAEEAAFFNQAANRR